jgi:hypothetical protein
MHITLRRLAIAISPVEDARQALPATCSTMSWRPRGRIIPITKLLWLLSFLLSAGGGHAGDGWSQE